MGQLASARSDIFSKEFTAELSKLQDRVPALTYEEVCRTFKEDLGVHPEEALESFKENPIASASLSQVHKATLRGTKEAVVVKVQRRGLRDLFDVDMSNLKLLAKQIDRQNGNDDCASIYEECERILYGEIDFIREGRNADRFRRSFRGSTYVKVPRVHWRFSSERVITLEYLPGTKITDVELLRRQGFDADRIANAAVESYIEQFLNSGFYQADPHPGNIAVDPNANLVFYDFGMCGMCFFFFFLFFFVSLFACVRRGILSRVVRLTAHTLVMVGRRSDRAGDKGQIAHALLECLQEGCGCSVERPGGPQGDRSRW